MSSSHGRPQDFFSRGGEFRDAKQLTTFSVVTLNTQVFTAKLLMHKTLYNISRGQVPSKHFICFEGDACVFVERGACATAQWHNGHFKPAIDRRTTVATTSGDYRFVRQTVDKF